jgi:hypothetical protein
MKMKTTLALLALAASALAASAQDNHGPSSPRDPVAIVRRRCRWSPRWTPIMMA